MSQSNTVLPYKYYTFPVFFLLIFGLIDTLYLIYSHHQNYTDTTFSSFCALSKAINCDTVSQSPWSIMYGLPLAYWGFLAYLFYSVLFVGTLRKNAGAKTLWYILFFLGALYSIASVYFGYISATKIKAYCLLCLVSYVICFSLFFYSWIILRRFCSEGLSTGIHKGLDQFAHSRLITGGSLGILIILICLIAFLPKYWQYTFPTASTKVDSGITEEGDPWIGSNSPLITIHEYTDYQCFQCRKMHFFLRQLIDSNPEKIKLIHHHYPMDHEYNNIIVPKPFHIGSGKMAMLGIYAAAKHKFWEMNDALYAMGELKEAFNTRTLAKMTGLASGELAAATRYPPIRNKLLYDIRQGMKLGITGTPTFIIDGKLYQGSIPNDILDKIRQ